MGAKIEMELTKKEYTKVSHTSGKPSTISNTLVYSDLWSMKLKMECIQIFELSGPISPRKIKN